MWRIEKKGTSTQYTFNGNLPAGLAELLSVENGRLYVSPHIDFEVTLNGTWITIKTEIRDGDELVVSEKKSPFTLPSVSYLVAPTPKRTAYIIHNLTRVGASLEDSHGEEAEESPIQPISRETTPGSDPVKFTAYYPREHPVDQRGTFILYAHLSSLTAAIMRDVKKFVDDLGGEIPRPRTASQTAQFAKNTPITVTLLSDDPTLEIDPPALTLRWNEDWLRYTFNFRAASEKSGESVMVQAVISVYGLEIARVTNCAIELLPPVTTVPTIVASTNPLAAAKLAYEESTVYQKIFVSYSRADTNVVEMYKLAQEALGNEVFVDTYSIRTGQDWQAALAKAIDSADVFQLFWSENSAKSENVRDEWDYALKYRCSEDSCRTFIRPVFWVKPLPVKPPPELGHLNFRYVNLKDHP